ncbi:MAG: response regulator [Bacteroides sp.]|nr:response regulator [Bacteroides sp.]MCM1550831.1 response regulator [Clostridium sp.]
MEIKDYKMILDSMQLTGVYVIREDDHQILYFNKRMKEIAPGIETGIVCHELWPGSCANCPLLHIGDRKQNRSIGFDAPFGKMVDISANRIQWGEEEIPSFVLAISPHAETLSYTYDRILRGNLTTDRFEIIKSFPAEEADLIQDHIPLSEWLKQFIEKGYVYHDDIERFQDFIRLEYLREALKNGKEKLVCIYRRRVAKGYRWYTLEVVPDPDYSQQDQVVMLYVKDMHDIYRESLELEEINIQNQEIINSLGEQNFGVYVVNLKSGMSNAVRVTDDLKELVRQGILEWDVLLREVVERYLHPEYKDRILSTFSLESLRKSKEEGRDKLEVLCLRKHQGEFRYVSAAAYFNNESNRESPYVILALQDVDEQTRQEIKRSRDDLRMAAIIKSRYNIMDTVDLDTGMFERLYLHEADEARRVQTGSYEAYIQKTVTEEVFEEDRTEFLRVRSLENLRNMARDVEDFSEISCRYRIKGPPVSWIKDHAFFVRYDKTVMVNILGRDITFEKLRESADQKLKRERALIINSLSDMFFATYFVDLDKNIFRMVTQMEAVGEILGEILGSEMNYREGIRAYAQRFVHPDDREEYLKHMDYDNLLVNLSEEHPMVAVEYQRIKSEADDSFQNDGWIRATIILAEAADGRPRKAIYVAQDITESKEKEEAERRILKEAYDSATYANAAKSEFLSRMSHDIRTPMNAIIGMTAIASSHLDDVDRVEDCLNKITVSSKHLLSLINEVLDMSRIESGKIDLTEEEFNLSDLIQNLITMIRPSVQAKEHKLDLRIMKVEHEDLIGDTLRLQQVFTNILGNAVKYTPKGGKLELLIKEKPSKVFGYACFEFVFRDNGIGMSEDFLKKIYEPFSRAEDSRISKIEGTGLGMTIAMNIIHMMNGNISVESRLGEGSKFTVTVYLKRQQTSMLDTKRLANLPVLVVDDDRKACETTCAVLEEIGMKSEFVTCGEDAVSRAKEAHESAKDFFAVILDLQMPEMDGIQTARAIRREVGLEIPIIILSAYDWSDVEAEARQAGVDGFLSKPPFKSKLVYLFKKFLGEESRSEEPEAIPVTEGAFQGKRILLVEDNELNREIAEEVIGSTGVMIESVSDGEQAVERFMATEPGYYDLIFMDIQMPVMNGYEAAASIRMMERPDAETIPIIAMTANAFAEDVIASRQAGMNEHISKPLNMEQLVECMKSWIGKSDPAG